jgi:hypothetical protein
MNTLILSKLNLKSISRSEVTNSYMDQLLYGDYLQHIPYLVQKCLSIQPKNHLFQLNCEINCQKIKKIAFLENIFIHHLLEDIISAESWISAKILLITSKQ